HYQGYRNILIGNFSLLGWLFVGSLQFLIIIVIYKWESVRFWIKIALKQRLFYIFILAVAVLLSVSSSGIGEKFSSALDKRIHPLNVPIIGMQVILISSLILFYFIFRKWLGTKFAGLAFLKRDLIIMIMIGVFAFIFWSSVPLGESTFTDAQRPPNNEFYPTSDALHYEQGAHQVLVGNGLKAHSHVGYQMFLAVLHFLAGNGSSDILPIQLAIFSLAPVLLYKLIHLLHTRLSGVLISIFYIIKVRNSLLLSEHISLSSISDLMTEPMATLGVILISTLLVIWFLDPGKRKLMPLLAGAGLGWAVLIRTEILAMIPVIGFIMFVYFHKNFRIWVQGILIMGLGFILVAGPWMAYMYNLTNSPMAFLLGKGTYLERAAEQYKIDSYDPQETMEINLTDLFTYHMVNSLLQLVYILPSNHQPLMTLASLPDLASKQEKLTDQEGDGFSEKYIERYIRSVPYWRLREWNGHLVPRSYLPVLGTVMLIVLGLNQFKGRKAWLATLLILLVLSNSVVYAITGQSGGRSMQIVDWIPLVFYGIGISYILSLLLKQIGKGSIDSWLVEFQFVHPPSDNTLFRVKPIFIYISILLLIIGISYPLVHTLIPAKYDQKSLEEKLHQISVLSKQNPINEFDLLAENTDLVILYGRMISPRFFNAGERMLDSRSGTIPDYSFSRVEFYLVGTENIWVALPSTFGEELLPHGGDVILFGTKEDRIFDANGIQESGEYIKSNKVYLIESDQLIKNSITSQCFGPACK
ncbi:MAG: hypothetical protein MUO76_01240, partial [Anaerolineaceae bacterium]|nr:hypothetical protein [Anaerolineaceae bacterium]